MMDAIAATAALILLTGWVAYPVAMTLLGRFRARQLGSDEIPTASLPEVTIALATRDAPELIAARVADLLRSDYPSHLVQVVVAVDHASAFPVDRYRAQLPGGLSGARVVPGDPPGGKAAALNAALRASTTEHVVFADSAQTWDPPALRFLVQALGRPGVGVVTGAFAPAFEQGVFRAFWRFESWLRGVESRTGRVVGATGAIYAIRRRSWFPLPPGLICDDLFIPLRIGRAGGAIVLEPRALARDPRSFSRAAQVQRKVRTLTGVLQICAWAPWVLMPVRNPLWAPFLCHKLVRIATPILLLMVMAGLAWSLPAEWLVVAAGSGVLALAGLSVLLRWPPRRLGEEIFWAARLMGAPIQALANALQGRWDIWQPHSR